MSDNSDPGLAPVTDVPQPKRRIGCWSWFILLAIGAVVVALLLPPVHRGREANRRITCRNNLKQIGLALHSYHDDYHAFPPAYTVDAQGNPLHSWRTLILPYLDQLPLYNSIDLSKPWDDPVNLEFSQQRLPIYRCPSTDDLPNHTTYLASVAPNGCFRPAEPRLLSEITDSRSDTLMVIEVPIDRSVPWMSPHDADAALVLSIGPESKLAHPGGSHALMCDGTVHFLSESLSAEIRRALISIADGDPVGDY